jgi:RHS repeat-associated protein
VRGTDNVGSVRELAQTNGTVLDTITYDAFGTPHDVGTGDRFKFTGREWDVGTGQYFYRSRYYGADVGRFRSLDPSGFVGKDDNLFRYAGNEPQSRRDPTGKV